MSDLNVVSYRLDFPLKKYELEIYRSGVCRSLAELNIVNDELLWDSTGYVRLDHYLENKKASYVNEKLYRLLKALRRITEGFLSASLYLVYSDAISLDPDKVFISEKGDRAVLLPGHSDEGYIKRLCDLCSRYRDCSGDVVASKIMEQQAEGALDHRSLLRFLSSWELELRS